MNIIDLLTAIVGGIIGALLTRGFLGYLNYCHRMRLQHGPDWRNKTKNQ